MTIDTDHTGNTDTAAPARLKLPRVMVTLDDDRTIEVQITNRDLVNWDRTAAKHRWPKFTEAGAMHSTFCAWSAMRRDGTIPREWSFDDFAEVHCLQVADAERNGDAPDGEVGDDVDPFRLEAEQG